MNIPLQSGKPHYLCIDASNMLHRYFHGMPELFSKKAGVHTHALTAWINLFTFLNKRMSFLHPRVQPIVFFDNKRDLEAEGIVAPAGKAGEPGAYQLDYKGKRKPTDPILKAQLHLAVMVTNLLGIPHVSELGFEADTLLGSFVLNEKAAASSIYILSTDKDMLQLVGGNVLCVHPLNGGEYRIMDSEQVEIKLGVQPHQVADLLVMMGDASDNIPGIPGIGIKTAQKLLSEYGSLDGILAMRNEIPGSTGKKIREGLNLVPMLRRLVTFEHAPVRIIHNPRNDAALKAMLSYFEMEKTLRNLGLADT
jgi:DNA polymerase I